MSAATKRANITIRAIDELAQMRGVEELQKEVWQTTDLDVVPLTQLVATKEAGGVLIGAFDEQNLVGFIYGFPAIEHGRMAHHSHMLAVKPEYRNFDVGRRLKLAQRDQVLAQGIELMTWTFDPLQSLNAHFNFNKLGVISNRYLVNFYGEDVSSFLLSTGTDRLWVSWLIASEHVGKKVAGIDEADTSEVGEILVSVNPDDSPQRHEFAGRLDIEQAAIEIPFDINSLLKKDPGLVREWREATRWALPAAINSGFTVTGFVREVRGGRRIGKYLLSKGDLLSFTD